MLLGKLVSFAGCKITRRYMLGTSWSLKCARGWVSWLLLKYCIYCMSAPSLYRESTNSLIYAQYAIYLLFWEAGVNHKHHTINGQRGLSNVGRDNHLPSNGSIWLVWRWGLKNPLLEVRRQCRVQWDALEISYFRSQVLHLTLDAFASLFNFLNKVFICNTHIKCQTIYDC